MPKALVESINETDKPDTVKHECLRSTRNVLVALRHPSRLRNENCINDRDSLEFYRSTMIACKHLLMLNKTAIGRSSLGENRFGIFGKNGIQN